jgi:hypothetical protein
MGSRLLKSLFVLLLVMPVAVQAKTKADATFAFPNDRPVKIIVFRPDVEVASLGVSGLPAPNADWTADARKNLLAAIKTNQNAKSNGISEMPELTGDDGAYAAEYQALYRAVGDAMLAHNFGLGGKLATKKLPDGKYKFDWTLGPGAKHLGELGGGNYGLFLYSYDAFATAGRKAFQIIMLIASSAAGAGFLPQGGMHTSYASLVDLETGNIVWTNVYLNKKGDARNPDGALERVTKLLSTLPLREGEKKK